MKSEKHGVKTVILQQPYRMVSRKWSTGQIICCVRKEDVLRNKNKQTKNYEIGA